MADWIVQSKLEPSISVRGQLCRDRLCDRLDQALETRLGVVHAPAGYGKSTLLALWRARLLERGTPVAWLSLDQYDNTFFSFVTYLVAACRHADFLNGRIFSGISRDISVLPQSQLISLIVTGLGKCRGNHVLILDDLNRVTDREVLEFLNYLVASLPDNIHVVFGTREIPAQIALASLRVQGSLVEVEQGALCFDEQEIREFLRYWLDSSQDESWPAAVFERTEGWAVAVQIVRQWLKDGSPLNASLHALTGNTSELSDYFLEQVFESLPGETQAFLLATSILERVNGDIGNLLCDLTSGWTLLQELERQDMFVSALDRTRSWYRYHRLFSEFLQERLRRRGGARTSELHAKAAQWFFDNSHMNEAVNHALASGDSTCQAAIVDSLGGWKYALSGHIGAVGTVLDNVSQDILARYPRLWLAKIYLAIRIGELEEGHAQYRQFEQRYIAGSTDDKLLLSEARIIRSTLDVYGGKAVTLKDIAELEDLGDTIPNDNDLLHAARCNLLCAMYRDIGRFDKCFEIGDRAIAHYRATDSVYGETFIYFHEGFACALGGRMRDAQSLYTAGKELAEENFGPENDLVAIANAYLADVNYERNRIHEAQMQINACLSHIEKFDAWLDVYVAAYSTAMKLEMAKGSVSGMSDILHRARSTAINRSLSRLATAIDLAYQNCIAQLGCEADAHAGLQQGAPADRDVRSLYFSSDVFDLVEARNAIRADDYVRAEQALVSSFEQARAQQRNRSSISLLILLAQVQWAAGRKEAALATFEDAVSLSIFEGIKRPFIDEGKAPGASVRDLAMHADPQRGNRLRDAFIVELVSEIDAEEKSDRRSGELLSGREREVLRHMIRGQSNREISAAVGISVNTVKFHAKNIFSKLAVSSRKDAVSEAIRQRLI